MPQPIGLAKYKPQTMLGLIGQDVHAQVFVMNGLFTNEHSWKEVRTTLDFTSTAYACLLQIFCSTQRTLQAVSAAI
jgi:hypothetical protein